MSERILIIDDEETLRESLGRLLTREGYDVTTTGTGEDALELTVSAIYDLIISDIFLPGIDGLEVLRKVRERQPDQLIVLMSAFVEPGSTCSTCS